MVVARERLDEHTVGKGAWSDARRRVTARTDQGYVPVPSPALAWYEYVPTWVSISLFLHGLVLLVLVAFIGSPGTFGMAGEDSVRRVDVARAAQANDLQVRLAALEQQVTRSSGGAPAQSGDVSQRLVVLEGQIAALCARATPPCS